MASKIMATRMGGSRFVLRCSSLRALQQMLLSSSSASASSACSASGSKSRPPTASFHCGSHDRQWRNETPPGGLTEFYVYKPDSGIVWPDPNLGVFAPVDPKYSLPGNIGIEGKQSMTADSQVEEGSSDPAGGPRAAGLPPSDILTRYTAKEHQAQTLHSAQDYIQHNEQAESYVCSGILEAFPEMDGLKNLCCELQVAPSLLKKDIQALFPDRDVANSNLSVINFSQRTVNDMTGWSEEVEEEREALSHHFVAAAKEVCARLRNEGFWADFIDPGSGSPYYGKHTAATLFETNEAFRLLGFRIEDLGCCKVVSHREFGRNVFVGTLFTDAHPSTGVVQEMFADFGAVLGDAGVGSFAAKH